MTIRLAAVAVKVRWRRMVPYVLNLSSMLGHRFILPVTSQRPVAMMSAFRSMMTKAMTTSKTWWILVLETTESAITKVISELLEIIILPTKIRLVLKKVLLGVFVLATYPRVVRFS